MKSFRVKVTDETGQDYYWTVQAVQAVHLCTGKKPRQVRGWSFKDHEGYERFSEGNWLALVDTFKAVVSNYGFTTKLS